VVLGSQPLETLIIKIMKLLHKFVLFILLEMASSCAFFNDKIVDLSIGSNPPGADIFIEGRSYGKTPTIIKVEPKDYTITLTKEGYGSSNFNTPIWWGALRTDINGTRTNDGTRCMLDMMSVFFFFNAYNSTRCGDFKQKQYFITIPRTGNPVSSNSNSMMNIGRSPQEMINYYYNEDNNNNVSGSSQRQLQQPTANTIQQQYRNSARY
jgi:hypothetical protein